MPDAPDGWVYQPNRPLITYVPRAAETGPSTSRVTDEAESIHLGPESAGGRDANQGAPRPPVPPSEKENA